MLQESQDGMVSKKHQKTTVLLKFQSCNEGTRPTDYGNQHKQASNKVCSKFFWSYMLYLKNHTNGSGTIVYPQD